jgi:hypothetical protein
MTQMENTMNTLTKKELIQALTSIVELTQEDIDDLWDNHSEKEVAEVLLSYTKLNEETA